MHGLAIMDDDIRNFARVEIFSINMHPADIWFYEMITQLKPHSGQPQHIIAHGIDFINWQESPGGCYIKIDTVWIELYWFADCAAFEYRAA